MATFRKQQTNTAADRALDALPPDKTVKAGRIAMKYQIDPGDPVWLLVNAVADVECMSESAANAAKSAANAAKSIQTGISLIPDQVYSGAVKAGNEVKNALRVEIKARAAEAGESLKTIVDDAAKEGAKVLEKAAEGLNAKKTEVDKEVAKAISDRIDDGVKEFAQAAAAAGRAAARTSLVLRASNSLLTMSIIFAFFAFLGAALLWGYLLLEHRIVPDGVSAMVNPDGGTIIKANHGIDVETVSSRDCTGGTCVYIDAKIPNLP